MRVIINVLFDHIDLGDIPALALTCSRIKDIIDEFRPEIIERIQRVFPVRRQDIEDFYPYFLLNFRGYDFVNYEENNNVLNISTGERSRRRHISRTTRFEIERLKDITEDLYEVEISVNFQGEKYMAIHFKGEYVDDIVIHGRGKIISYVSGDPEGSYYDGEWKNGYPSVSMNTMLRKVHDDSISEISLGNIMIMEASFLHDFLEHRVGVSVDEDELMEFVCAYSVMF